VEDKEPLRAEVPQAKDDERAEPKHVKQNQPRAEDNSNNDNDNNTSSEPKSMRPTTARRRPPKVKENATEAKASVEVSKAKDSGIAKNAIMKEGGDAEDAFFRDEDEEAEAKDGNLGGGAEASNVANDGRNVGKLVQNILSEEEKGEEKMENENDIGNNGKKGIKLGLSLGGKSGQPGGKGSLGGGMSSADMEGLTNAVQRLVMSTAPLGKCMDYFSEDLALMEKEGEKWSETYVTTAQKYTSARQKSDEVLDPLRRILEQLEDEGREWEEKVKAGRRKVVLNEGRIKGLLRGVISG